MTEQNPLYKINIDDKNEFDTMSGFIDLNMKFRILLEIRNHKNQERFTVRMYKFRKNDKDVPNDSTLKRWISSGRLQYIKTLDDCKRVMFRFIQQSDDSHHFIEITKL